MKSFHFPFRILILHTNTEILQSSMMVQKVLNSVSMDIALNAEDEVKTTRGYQPANGYSNPIETAATGCQSCRRHLSNRQQLFFTRSFCFSVLPCFIHYRLFKKNCHSCFCSWQLKKVLTLTSTRCPVLW